jgi:hypothetical protein
VPKGGGNEQSRLAVSIDVEMDKLSARTLIQRKAGGEDTAELNKELMQRGLKIQNLLNASKVAGRGAVKIGEFSEIPSFQYEINTNGVKLEVYSSVTELDCMRVITPDNIMSIAASEPTNEDIEELFDMPLRAEYTQLIDKVPE